MKKLFFASGLLVAGLAFAGTTTITNDYILGVMPVTATGKPQVILSIPWVAEGGVTNAIAVTNLVKTAGLDVGDELAWYDTDKGKYMSWRVGSSVGGVSYWEPVTDVSDDSISIAVPEGMALKQGQALLLQRAHSNNVVYVVGQVGTNATITTTIKGASNESTPTYTLLAPPGALGRALNLNAYTEGQETKYDLTITGDIFATVGNNIGDMIVSEAYKGLTVIYLYNSTYNKWYPSYLKESAIGAYTGSKIPAGRGFWYKRVGTADLTVSWPAPVVAPVVGD